jgi:hypothetical protein
VRYTFSRPPAAGQRVTVTYVTPRHATYKTVTLPWPATTPRTITIGSLSAGAYRHRRGTWCAVLRVDGEWVKTKTFHVVR